MKQLTIVLAVSLLLSCNSRQSKTEEEFTTQLELHSIGYYDHFEAFDPPLSLDVKSEPIPLNLTSSDSIAVQYQAFKRLIDYQNGKPPVEQMAGSLIFLERINGEWNSIGGNEPPLDSIRVDKWIGQEIYMNNCDSGDEYFSADFRFLVAQN